MGECVTRQRRRFDNRQYGFAIIVRHDNEHIGNARIGNKTFPATQATVATEANTAVRCTPIRVIQQGERAHFAAAQASQPTGRALSRRAQNQLTR